MNDTRIWSAAHMRASFPHKKPKCVHHLQAEDALKEVVSSAQSVPLCIQGKNFIQNFD